MKKETATFKLTVELDSLPGWGHKAEDFQLSIQTMLTNRIPHYNPIVTIVKEESIASNLINALRIAEGLEQTDDSLCCRSCSSRPCSCAGRHPLF